MRGDENLAGTKGKSKKETSEFQRFFFYVGNIACDVSGILTKVPCKAALLNERHMCIESCILLGTLLSFVFAAVYRIRGKGDFYACRVAGRKDQRVFA